MHTLITGVTGSGKTTLAKMLVLELKRQGTSSIVLDPMRDPAWNAEYQTHNSEEFLDVMCQSRRCALFVDESGKTIGRYAKEMAQVATESRHYGHRAYFLSQRPAQIDVNVRDQCSEVYLFAVSNNDAKTLKDEFRWPEIIHASDLPAGQCIHFSRFKRPKLLTVFKPIVMSS